jgi:predicted aldo/keto reductase-like oxidoreductase
VDAADSAGHLPRHQDRAAGKGQVQGTDLPLARAADYVDLIQIHAVGDLEELDKVTGPGGSLEACIEAVEEGVAKAIGITGHGHQAPATHLEALRRYPFQAVLTPYNFVLASSPAYRRDFDRLAEECQRRDVALRVIKTIARGPWGEGEEHRYHTWYKPFDDQEHIDLCVWFNLSRPDICALAGPGDVRLLPKVVDAAERMSAMAESERDRLLAQAGAYASPFGPLP